MKDETKQHQKAAVDSDKTLEKIIRDFLKSLSQQFE